MDLMDTLKKARKGLKKFLTSQSTLDDRLHEAVKAGDIARVKAAVEDGANPSAPTRNWDTTNGLLMAIEAGNAEMVKALLELKADPDAKVGYRGLKPLMAAAKKGNVEIVTALLDAKADVNGADEYNQTAFLFATAARSRPVMDVLIARGAKTDVMGANGWTPLSYAVRNNDVESIALLLSKGARTDHRNDDGQGLLDIAREKDRTGAYRAIQAHYDSLVPKWQKMEDADEVAHIRIMRDAGYKLTEVFNTRTKHLTTITHNFETGRDETVVRGFNDGDKDAVAEAAAKLQSFKPAAPAPQPQPAAKAA